MLQLTDIQYVYTTYQSVGTNHIYTNILDKMNLIVRLINIEIDGNNFSFKVWLKQNNKCININIIKHVTDNYNNARLLGVI